MPLCTLRLWSFVFAVTNGSQYEAQSRWRLWKMPAESKNMDNSTYLMSDDNHIYQVLYLPFCQVSLKLREMLIARAHVHIEVKRVCGHQYHYSGHTVYAKCR